MEQSRELFEKMPVPKAVAKNAIPAVISMLVIFLYNIADTFFVGQTGDEFQVAAVTVTTPVFLLFMAFGALLGVGGTSVISRALGEGKNYYAKNVSSFCFYISIGLGMVLMILSWIFMPFILKFIGTSNYTIDFARDYLKYVAISAPFVIFSQAFSNIIRTEGKPNQAMAGMMMGTIINIILDPVMILGLEMGVVGAAVATVIGNVASALYYYIYLIKGKTILSVKMSDFKIGEHIFTGVMAIGIPVSVNNILMSVSNILMNNFLVQYGDTQLAAMGIAIRASLVIILIQLGLGQSIQPLLGYNYGAGNLKRIKEVIRFSLSVATVIGVLITVVYWFGAQEIIRAFIDKEEVIIYGIYILKVLLISGPFIGIMFIFINALQAMGKAIPSMVLSLSRQGLIFIPLLFILNAVIGLNGIVYSQPVADIFAVILSAIIYLKVEKRYEKKLNEKINYNIEKIKGDNYDLVSENI